MLTHDLAVGQRAGGTRDHAFAAGDAIGRAHGRVHVKSNAGGITLTGASDDVVVANFAAGTHATVTEDAGGVIDQDAERRLVLPFDDGAVGEAVVADAVAAGHRFKFAIAGMLLADAGRRVV